MLISPGYNLGWYHLLERADISLERGDITLVRIYIILERVDIILERDITIQTTRDQCWYNLRAYIISGRANYIML